MRRPFKSSRPVGPFMDTSSGLLSFSNGDREVSHTILLGMESGPAPSMGGMEDEFVSSMEFTISNNTELEMDDFHVFSESIVARELGNGSLWMAVIKLHRPDLTNDEVRSIAVNISGAIVDLGFNVQDTAIFTGDFFRDEDAKQIE